MHWSHSMTTNQQIKYQVLELLFEGPGTHHQVWNRNRKVCSWKSFKLIFETLRWAGLIQRHPYQKQERLFPDELMGTPIFELVEDEPLEAPKSIRRNGDIMKIGQLVRYPKNCEWSRGVSILGVIVELNPLNDDNHTEIFWLDSDQESGLITSVWLNEDFEITNFQDPDVKSFLDELEELYKHNQVA